MTGRIPRVLMVFAFLSAKEGSHSVAADLAGQLRQRADSVICVSSRRSALMRCIDMVSTTFLRRREYDVAIVGLYSGRAFLWGEAVTLLLEKLRHPFVIAMHGGALPEFAAHHSRRVTRTLAKASAVTAPSGYLAERMRPYRADIIQIPNPIELARYEFTKRDHVQPKLVWLRAFHETYNPALAIEVAGLVRNVRPDLHLTMVGPDKGDGSWQRTATAAAKALPPEAFVMPGGVANSDVPQWLNRGDIFINTTDVDNTPVSVLEAMACGLPVVSTNVGGIPHLLTDGQDALLVPRGDSKSMAAAVLRLLSEPGLAAKLSANARRKVEGLDWPHVWPLWQDLLEKVTASRG